MTRMELVSGVERRRRWSDDAKLRILAEADRAGARIAEVARRHDIFPAQIRYWRKTFTTFGLQGDLIPVNIVDEAGPSAQIRGPGHAARSAPTVEVTLWCGRSLKVPADIAPETLAALIVCVEAA